MNIFKKLLIVVKYLLPAVFILCFHYYSNNSSDTENYIKKPDIIINKEFKAIIYVPNSFSDVEKDLIEEAAFEWNIKTKGLVNLYVQFEPFKFLDFNSGIMLVKTNAYDPDIMVIDYSTQCFCTLGLTLDNHLVPNIKIVYSRINDKNHFYSVVLHELGHYIGLSHTNDWLDISSLMYPSIPPSLKKEITRKDLKQFCDIYNCDKFKREEILNDWQSYRIYLP